MTFNCLKHMLWLGLNPPEETIGRNIDHRPIISIKKDEHGIENMQRLLSKEEKYYTHIIFTSKTAVELFIQVLTKLGLNEKYFLEKTIISVGQTTTKALQRHSIQNEIITAYPENAEGVVQQLKRMNLIHAKLLWPHAKEARNVISEAAHVLNIPLTECILYQTVANPEFSVCNLLDYDEIMFTSPSCVKAFVECFTIDIPSHLLLVAIGEITHTALTTYNFSNCIVRYADLTHDKQTPTKKQGVDNGRLNTTANIT